MKSGINSFDLQQSKVKLLLVLFKYPHIDINVNYVYPIDDKADGHFDIYKHDFWDYPWPQALGRF